MKLLSLLGLIVTGGHDNLILVWTLDSLGKLIDIVWYVHAKKCKHVMEFGSNKSFFNFLRFSSSY